MVLFTQWQWDFFSITFLTLVFFASIQLFYVAIVFGRLAFYKEEEKKPQALPPISIIIAARNESDNLYENLPYILTQDYPEFEVIIVNNQSVDI